MARNKFTGSKYPNKRWQTAWENKISYMHYYQYFKNLAINMFQWSGLPDTIDPRFLELSLFERGMALFFEDPVIGYLALNCTIGGNLNVYNIPIERVAFANNGYYLPRTADDSVLIFDNFLHSTKHMDVDYFARKLYNIDRTIDVNLNAQKTPVIVTCPEEKKLTFLNMYKDIDGNEPVIYGYDSLFDDSEIKVLKTDAPYVADKLLVDRAKIWNDAMTFLGVDNANTEKRERMVTSEVDSNNGQTALSREIGLNARRQACEEINRMFGLNVSVDYNENVSRETSAPEEEVEIDE